MQPKSARIAGSVITASTFNQLVICQQSWSQDLYCYAERTAVSSLPMAIAIAGTHFAYHRGMTRLSWPGWVGYQDGVPVCCQQSPISVLTQLDVE